MVELVGPRPDGWDLVVGGYRLPFLTAHPHDPEDTGPEARWDLVLDRRFALVVTRAEIGRWGWLLGQAMAIAAGYESLEGPALRDPFAQRSVTPSFPSEDSHG